MAKPKMSPSIRVAAFLLGGTGFVCGFFGPMLLNPDANQGPLLGLFVTGPAGLVLGLLLGAIFKWLPIDAGRKWISLIGTCGIGGIVILFFCFPEPRVLGHVVKGSITSCSSPADHMHEAVVYWNKRIDAMPWVTPRVGWRDTTARMLQDDGVVIEISSADQASLLEHRKPWNSGDLSLSEWRASMDSQTYFARFNGSDCTLYSGDIGLLYATQGRSSDAWPPTDLQHFLNLALIDPLPGRYKHLID